MQGDTLATFLFWLTLFVTFGLESVKAETTIRRVIFGLLALGFLLISIFWLQIKQAWPHWAERGTIIANHPVSWFAVLMFLAAILAFHRPGSWPWFKRNATKDKAPPPIQFSIRKTYVAVPGRDFIGKSIIRCDAIAVNSTADYLEDCQFTAKVEMSIFEKIETAFSGHIPPRGGRVSLHLFDLLLDNIGGEFLGYRFHDTGSFQRFNDLALIDLQFSNKGLGLIEKSFHVRGPMEAAEYVIASDDKEERDSILDSLGPDDEDLN